MARGVVTADLAKKNIKRRESQKIIHAVHIGFAANTNTQKNTTLTYREAPMAISGLYGNHASSNRDRR